MNNQIKPKNEHFTPESTLIGRFFLYFSMLLIIPIFWYIWKRNWFNRSKQKIEETASGIDVQLKKRKDVLIKLVDSVKGYMKFENETLSEITAMRSKPINNIKDMSEVNDDLNKIQRSINVQLENYPNLKTIEAINSLQKAVQDCEDNIAAARRFYNSEVRLYNQSLKTYPSNVIAATMNLESEFYFEASEQDRLDVKITFN